MTSPTNLDEQLCFALYSASVTIQESYQQEFDRLGIDYGGYVVLLCLFEDPRCTIGDLGDRLGLDFDGLVGALGRLESQGYVASDGNWADGILLTSRGEDLRGPISLLQKSVREHLDLSDAEIDALRGLAGRVCRRRK